jgi:hypothetical protein
LNPSSIEPNITKELTMTTTRNQPGHSPSNNGDFQRKTLSHQLDRFDTILDGLHQQMRPRVIASRRVVATLAEQ